MERKVGKTEQGVADDLSNPAPAGPRKKMVQEVTERSGRIAEELYFQFVVSPEGPKRNSYTPAPCRSGPHTEGRPFLSSEVTRSGSSGPCQPDLAGLVLDEQARLSRRERQVMDIVYSLNEATAAEAQRVLRDPVSCATVRSVLRRLEGKGLLKHGKKGRTYVYKPGRSRHHGGQLAFRRVLNVYFDGSLEKALACYLADPATTLAPDQRDRLVELFHTPIVDAWWRRGQSSRR
jgi:predicted transcriptional regulator